MRVPISIVLPVGPFADDQKYIKECLESIENQILTPEEVIVVADYADVDAAYLKKFIPTVNLHVVRNEWRFGCATSWNRGVARAATDCCLLMGADDWLEPFCTQQLWDSYLDNGKREAYYWLAIRYSDGTEQRQACNAAMITRRFWKQTGGFAPESGLGAPDALLISCMMVHHPEMLIGVIGPPSYNVRIHEGQDTRRTGKYHQQIIDVRNIATATYKDASWTK